MADSMTRDEIGGETVDGGNVESSQKLVRDNTKRPFTKKNPPQKKGSQVGGTTLTEEHTLESEQMDRQQRTEAITNAQERTPTGVKLPTGVTEKEIPITTEPIGEVKVTERGMVENPQPNDVVSGAVIDATETEKAGILPSPLREILRAEDLNGPSIEYVELKGQGYACNLRAMPVNYCPFQEDPPTRSDIQAITGYDKLKNFENAYIYKFYIPGHNSDIDRIHENPCWQNLCKLDQLPAVVVMRAHLQGDPLVTEEYPVVASPNMSFTASYLHSVQARMSPTGAALDMRFGIKTRNPKGTVKEEYVLGRMWTPLTKMHIHWDQSSDNYDACAPILAPAYASLERLTQDSVKEITNLASIFHVADQMPTTMSGQIISILQRISYNKLSFSRLYWRIWCCILECTYAENKKTRWKVTNPRARIRPTHLNNMQSLAEFVRDFDYNKQPFFLTSQMETEYPNIDWRNYLTVLLSENFLSENAFALTTNWPPLGDVQLVLPRSTTSVWYPPEVLEMCSSQLYEILAFFGDKLGQRQLIDEIGRTVMTFAFRPEGEGAWLGHNVISMELPPFRCLRTLHFAWKMESHPRQYRPKRVAYYKMVWLGVIRYMMISLGANMVLSEVGLFTTLQLLCSGVEMPETWYQRMCELLDPIRCGTELNQLIQRTGLRADWGCLLNKITGSIRLLRTNFGNFSSIVQWSEWLLFNRQLSEGTWMAAQLAHMKPKHFAEPGKLYTPRIFGVASSDSDILYRLMVEQCCKIKIRVTDTSDHSQFLLPNVPMATPTGLPLDGQFRHIRIADELECNFEFMARDTVDSMYIDKEWSVRQNYQWHIVSPKQMVPHGYGKLAGEPILSASTRFPEPNERLSLTEDGQKTYNVFSLMGFSNPFNKAIRFGSPQSNSKNMESYSPQMVNDLYNMKSVEIPLDKNGHVRNKALRTRGRLVEKPIVNWFNASGAYGDNDAYRSTRLVIEEPDSLIGLFPVYHKLKELAAKEDTEGVHPEEMHSQEYPIHYCEMDREPTVGERMFAEGMKSVANICGIPPSIDKIIDGLVSVEERKVESIPYEPPEEHVNWQERFKAEHKGRFTVRIRAPERSMEDTEAKRIAREKEEEEKRQKNIEKFKADQAREAAEKKARIQKQKEDYEKHKKSTAPRVIEVKKNKAIFYGYAKSFGVTDDDLALVNKDTVWTGWDGMEAISTSALGSDIALSNRFRSIINNLDNTDLLSVLRNVPLVCRAEFCRINRVLLTECSCYMPPGAENIDKYNRINVWLSNATENLAMSPALTLEELKLGGIFPSDDPDWGACGSMDKEQFEAHFFEMMCSSMPPDDPKPDDSSASADDDGITELKTKDDEFKEAAKTSTGTVEAKINSMVDKTNVAIDKIIDGKKADSQSNFCSAGSVCSAQSPQSSASSLDQKTIHKSATAIAMQSLVDFQAPTKTGTTIKLSELSKPTSSMAALLAECSNIPPASEFGVDTTETKRTR